MKNFLQILLLFIIISCKSEKQKQFEQEIVGEWNYVKDVEINRQKSEDIEEPPSPFFANIGGFIFKNDGTLIDKIGFFDFDEKKYREERRVKFIGDSTQYKIDDESLKILNPISKTWNNFKIISITKDTLTLQKHKNYYIKYQKTNFKLNPNETFDKISISSSGCYGTCPIMSIEFDKNGEVYYLGEKYNLIDGFYVSKIGNSEYMSIENSFKKSNISQLKNSYSARVTDLNTITVTFFKDNKIVKTVSDYGNQAPAEFIMAYKKAIYIYQKQNLNPIKSIEDLPNSTTFSIDKANKHIFLSESEKFILLNEIRKGKKVSLNINPIYKLTFYNEDDYETEKQIYSDGRYFKSGNTTYDIGYNFIKTSNLENREEPY